MIDRRRVWLSLSAASALPALVRAQPLIGVPVVGLVLPNVTTAEMEGANPRSHLARGFVQGLAEGGWIDGRTVRIERRSANGNPRRAGELLRDLVERHVDVIAVGGARWLQDAARNATQTIPVVAIFPSDPVTAGMVRSLGRPGGNLTGVMFATGPDFTGKQLQLLEEVSPQIGRIAMVAVKSVLEQYAAVATIQRSTVVPIRVDAATEYDSAFDQIHREKVDAMLVAGGPPNVVNAFRLADFAASARLPSLYGFREGPESGGLMSYGPSIAGIFRQMGVMAGKFLAGARIGEIPTEQPAIFELVVNLKAAAALDLVIPPAIRVRADELIE